MYKYWCCQCYGGICCHNTDNINIDTHIGTRYVILAKHWTWLPDEGFMWTETCWSSFYNFNYFNNLRILWFVCISWKTTCLILLMHGATMKFRILYLRLYKNSWCQTFALLCFLYSFLWVITDDWIFLAVFSELCSIFITYLWKWNRVFRSVGTENSDAGKSPKRKNTTRVQ